MEKIYELILDTDHNVKPYVLTFGSLLFYYIDRRTCSFNFDKFRRIAKEYALYSEKNICETFRWLEEHEFICYSKSCNSYFVSYMMQDILNFCSYEKNNII